MSEIGTELQHAVDVPSVKFHLHGPTVLVAFQQSFIIYIYLRPYVVNYETSSF